MLFRGAGPYHPVGLGLVAHAMQCRLAARPVLAAACQRVNVSMCQCVSVLLRELAAELGGCVEGSGVGWLCGCGVGGLAVGWARGI
ncbi:predicted protein [Chaetomium globosum CBS 148.51]|uniref:Uncharacterized protein n=1 Tax=Chaetomium globosum (strain ATCC 6205 / CBS 148.51 / DSM 1962 / NBRC 6347 / NRRL 1970) TaxID=306901 RepID=Q2HGQ5_CHAGB|nr:uncharacterized protein CHGG_00599 [Chaetomium globosum CBS 148.51]EAQ92364.1 predicted protein [Chaetomium globosum CBS 148.51]